VATVSCQPARDPEVPAYATDSCDEAVAAARAVAEVDGRVASRIYLRSGVFDCDNYWPGVGSPGFCPMPTMLSGVTMYGWVSFAGDDRVAAVALYREPPSGLDDADAAPWTAQIKAFAVPPSGWVMP
jgi:hypothetical protein